MPPAKCPSLSFFQGTSCLLGQCSSHNQGNPCQGTALLPQAPMLLLPCSPSGSHTCSGQEAFLLSLHGTLLHQEPYGNRDILQRPHQLPHLRGPSLFPWTLSSL